MDRGDVVAALCRHLGVAEIGDDVAIVSGEVAAEVLAGARVILFDGSFDEPAWTYAWSEHGFRRDLSFEHGILVRRDTGDWIAASEARAGALVREVEARTLVSMEYHEAHVAEIRRNLETEYLTAPSSEHALGDPRVWNVVQGLVELQRRWAPADSLRTRALQVAFTGIHQGQRGVLRVLDVRDAVLDRVRGKLLQR